MNALVFLTGLWIGVCCGYFACALCFRAAAADAAAERAWRQRT